MVIAEQRLTSRSKPRGSSIAKRKGNSTMRFMMLVKATNEFEAGVLPDEETLSKMAAYTAELVKAGALLESGRLQPSSKGLRVHYAHGKFTLTDGPFAETKELIAGFCMIQAKAREEAIEWAKRV